MITILLLYIVVGVVNAVMDRIRNTYSETIFSHLKTDYWNPERSWVYKWKNGDPKQGERFPFSSTILVFLTDGWHLCKWLMFTIIEICICLDFEVSWCYMVAGVLVLKVVRGLGFNFFYEKVLIK